MGMVKLYVWTSAIVDQYKIDDRILAYTNPVEKRQYWNPQNTCQHSTIFGGAL